MNTLYEQELQEKQENFERFAVEKGVNPEDVYFYIKKYTGMPGGYVQAYLNARSEGRADLRAIQRGTRMRNSYIISMMNAEDAFHEYVRQCLQSFSCNSRCN